MKSLLRSMPAGLAALCLSAAMLATPMLGVGAANAVSIQDSFAPNIVPKCYAAATSTTVALTSAVDITGLTCAFVPKHYDPTTAARPRADLIRVGYSLSGLKATGTYADCGVYVNGALDTSAGYRRIAYATPTVSGATFTISGVFTWVNTTVGAQTIKMQCISADTSTLTISLGQFFVDEIVRQ